MWIFVVGPLPLRSGYFMVPLVVIGGRAECRMCADMGVRTPIGTSGIYYKKIQKYNPTFVNWWLTADFVKLLKLLSFYAFIRP